MNQEELEKKISSILFVSDPMGINFEDNSDEYDPEARELVKMIAGKNSTEEELVSAVHKVFVDYFDNNLVGGRQRFENIAKQILEILS